MSSYLLLLQKSVNPVNGLDKVVELESDPAEYRVRAVVLKIRAGAEH